MSPEVLINAAVPYRGACGVCGCCDARHRVFNAIKERDDPQQEVEDYGYPLEAVQAIIDLPWDHPLHDPQDKGVCAECGWPLNINSGCDRGERGKHGTPLDMPPLVVYV